MGLNVLGYNPISPRLSPYDFLSRYKFSTFTTQPTMVEIFISNSPLKVFQYHEETKTMLVQELGPDVRELKVRRGVVDGDDACSGTWSRCPRAEGP